MNHTQFISKSVSYCIRKLQIPLASTLSVAMVLSLTTSSYVLASTTSNYTQVINAGTLAVDIVDASYVTVSSPSVSMSAKTFSFTCLSGGSASTGTFGTSTEQIYVANPDAADNGWTIALAASDPADVWNGAIKDYDFNDSASSGCADTVGGADADAFAGQLTVNPNAGTLAVGSCLTCVTTNITKGSSAPFVEGSTDSITILTGAAESNDIGNWKLTGVSLSQTIPAEQPADNTYNIDFVLSVTAS